MDLLQTNSSMSKQILSLQSKTDQFEEKLSTFKKYKWMLHHAAGIQCIQCSQLFNREDFSTHLQKCKQALARVSTINAQQAIVPI